MNPLIFRKCDIRGVVETDLTPDVVCDLGRAYGTFMREKNLSDIVVGGDCRLSTEALKRSLIDGILSTGCDVVDIGTCTTPMLYFSFHHLKKDGGIMVTGSHNPPECNGFKVCVGEETIFGDDIQTLRQMIDDRRFVLGLGTLTQYDLREEYEAYLVSQCSIPNPVRVAIDAGNGTAGEIILPILKKLGVEVVPLNCEMDGTFPVHHPDPTIEKNVSQMIDVVREQKLDCGIGFDGDGDRIGVVDETGAIIWGDSLLMIFAREILKRRPGTTFISEVKSSQVLYDDIEKHGGNAVMWKAGHSLIKAKMKETGAVLAGEMSGHFFFADRFLGFDDGIYAALRLLEIVSTASVPLSAMLTDVPRMFSTPELRIACPDDEKFAVVDVLKAQLADEYNVIDIDGVRVVFDDGWGLIRASNTQPVLVMRFEAQSESRLDEIKEWIEEKVTKIRKEVH